MGMGFFWGGVVMKCSKISWWYWLRNSVNMLKTTGQMDRFHGCKNYFPARLLYKK